MIKAVIKVALVSYNPLFPYSTPIVKKIKKVNTLFLPRTFAPKSVTSVHSEDKHFQLLLKHKQTLRKIFIFAGKKESGALEIIRLFAEAFADKREVLFFILCDHELQEKIDLLHALGIQDFQWVSFADSHKQCRETPIMLGYWYHYINLITHVVRDDAK